MKSELDSAYIEVGWGGYVQKFGQVVHMFLISALRKQRQADLCSDENGFLLFTGVGTWGCFELCST